MDRIYKTSQKDRERSARRYYAKREEILKKQKAQYTERSSEIQASVREYRRRNRGIIQERRRTASYRFAEAKSLAKTRGLAWAMTREEYVVLMATPCHYCGSCDIATGIGLDRLRNDHGYESNNVVRCCGVCNRIKSDFFSEAEMQRLGAVLREILKARISNVRTVNGTEERNS